MTPDSAIELVREAAWLGLLVAAPALAVSLAVGLVTSLLQAVTQVQEQTLHYVPRLILVAATVLALLPWTMDRLADFALHLFRSIPGTS